MIAIQAIALGYLTGSFPLPIAAMVLSLIALTTSTRFDVTRDNRIRLYMLVIIVFILKHQVVPPKVAIDQIFIRTEVALGIAQCVLALQVMTLFFVHRERWSTIERVTAGLPALPAGIVSSSQLPREAELPLPLLLPSLGCVALVMSFDVQVSRTHGRMITQILSICFAISIAFYYASTRNRLRDASAGQVRRAPLTRYAAFFAIISLVATLAWAGSIGLYTYEDKIAAWIANMVNTEAKQRAGVSNRSQLGNVAWQKLRDADGLLLRVYSEKSPGYLRGMVLDTMEQSSWRSPQPDEDDAPPLRQLSPTSRFPDIIEKKTPGSRVFRSFKAPKAANQEIEIWPVENSANRVFSKLETSYLRIELPQISQNGHSVFVPDGRLESNPYSVYQRPLDEAIREELDDSPRILARCLNIPRRYINIERRGTLDIHALAREIFRDCGTTAEKITAVERHFHQNYQYRLGIEIPLQHDPLIYFLNERPPAHCEYFASGAALLLRLGGVPCRYVTGLVVSERNEWSDCWVARNRDAHAWVEAYDEKRGWVVVEATPATGVPDHHDTSQAKQVWEQLLNLFRQMQEWSRTGGLVRAVEALIALLRHPVVILLILALAAMILFRKKLRRRLAAAQDPRLLSIHKLLRKMDARLRVANVRREEGETLSRFVRRLREEFPDDPFFKAAAEWYQHYIAYRFRGQIGEEALQELLNAMPDARLKPVQMSHPT